MTSAVQWVIESESEAEARYIEKWGREEFNRRKKVAAEKVDQFPRNEYETRIVVGNQFESVAMQASQEIFDKLENLDYKFWVRLVYKVCGV